MAIKKHSTEKRSIIPLNDTNFYVFWEDELEHYHVTIDSAGNITCHGRSDGERCWPWYQHPGHCPHIERVEEYLAEQAGVKPLSPAKKFIAEQGGIEAAISSIWDYSQPCPVQTHIPTNRRQVQAGYRR